MGISKMGIRKIFPFDSTLLNYTIIFHTSMYNIMYLHIDYMVLSHDYFSYTLRLGAWVSRCQASTSIWHPKCIRLQSHIGIPLESLTSGSHLTSLLKRPLCVEILGNNLVSIFHHSICNMVIKCN